MIIFIHAADPIHFDSLCGAFGAVPLALASNLPACPSDKSAYWHNCVGTYTFADGDKYSVDDALPNPNETNSSDAAGLFPGA